MVKWWFDCKAAAIATVDGHFSAQKLVWVFQFSEQQEEDQDSQLFRRLPSLFCFFNQRSCTFFTVFLIYVYVIICFAETSVY